MKATPTADQLSLTTELRAYKDRQNGKANPNNLVFPTANGEPDKNWSELRPYVTERQQLLRGRVLL